MLFYFYFYLGVHLRYEGVIRSVLTYVPYLITPGTVTEIRGTEIEELLECMRFIFLVYISQTRRRTCGKFSRNIKFPVQIYCNRTFLVGFEREI